MKYRIPVFWQMFDWIEVEAITISEAIEKVMDDDVTLPDGVYVDGSFEVELESLAEDYPNELENNA